MVRTHSQGLHQIYCTRPECNNDAIRVGVLHVAIQHGWSGSPLFTCPGTAREAYITKCLAHWYHSSAIASWLVAIYVD